MDAPLTGVAATQEHLGVLAEALSGRGIAAPYAVDAPALGAARVVVLGARLSPDACDRLGGGRAHRLIGVAPARRQEPAQGLHRLELAERARGLGADAWVGSRTVSRIDWTCGVDPLPWTGQR